MRIKLNKKIKNTLIVLALAVGANLAVRYGIRNLNAFIYDKTDLGKLEILVNRPYLLVYVEVLVLMLVIKYIFKLGYKITLLSFAIFVAVFWINMNNVVVNRLGDATQRLVRLDDCYFHNYQQVFYQKLYDTGRVNSYRFKPEIIENVDYKKFKVIDSKYCIASDGENIYFKKERLAEVESAETFVKSTDNFFEDEKNYYCVYEDHTFKFAAKKDGVYEVINRDNIFLINKTDNEDFITNYCTKYL
jgi:hypothetical protein